METVTDFSQLKIYSPGYQAIDWGFDYPQVVGLEEALSQPTKIAVLPVYYNNPQNFAYKEEFQELDLLHFDLVLFTDIQFTCQTDLINWISTTGAQNWLLSVAGLYSNETLDPRVIYRPWWSFTFLKWNPPRDDFPLERPYLYDCLCGSRRDHRDYVMLSLEKHNLLDKGIATYRDIFIGNSFNQTPQYIAKHFPGQSLTWPYVSPNLDPAWEVRENLDNSISSIVPWEIYNRTYFSILVETLSSGDCYLMAEKIGKCLHSKRLFVHFGVVNWLKRLQSFGFKTFDGIIDESYDKIENNVDRWQAAFEQVRWLSQQNHTELLLKVKPILDHNHHRLYEFRQEKYDEMRRMIEPYLR
jgi:hypothetical protein